MEKKCLNCYHWKSCFNGKDWDAAVGNPCKYYVPSADVVEVVRCKNCKWWEARTFGSSIGRCENPRNGLDTDYLEDDAFCSYGERKDS